MEDHLAILKKWASISEDRLAKIILLLNQDSGKYNSILTFVKSCYLYYLYELKKSNIKLEEMTPGEMISGIVFLILMFTINLIYYGSEIKYTVIWDFMLFYIFFDHQLDSKRCSKMFKHMMVTKIKDYTLYPEQKTDHLIYDKYCYYARNPTYQFYLFRVVIAEIFGVRFQKSSLSFSRDDYLNIAIIKGATTTEAIGALLEVPPQDLSLLGTCCQLIDDITDVEQDITRNTETTATFDKKKDNYVDATIIDLICFVDQLPEHLNVFKVLFCDALVILAHKHDNHFSPTLVSQFQQTLNVYPQTINLLSQSISHLLRSA